MNQAGHFAPVKEHGAASTSTLAADRLDATCGDPGANGSRRYPEVVDDLRHRDQDIIGACIHVAILSKRENDVKNNLLSHVA